MILLADANGGGSPLPPLEVSTPSATPSVTPEPTPEDAVPLPTTETSIELPPVDTGDVSGDTGTGFSWLLFLVIVVAVIGGIVTLYLRNRK